MHPMHERHHNTGGDKKTRAKETQPLGDSAKQNTAALIAEYSLTALPTVGPRELLSEARVLHDGPSHCFSPRDLNAIEFTGLQVECN